MAVLLLLTGWIIHNFLLICSNLFCLGVNFPQSVSRPNIFTKQISYISSGHKNIKSHYIAGGLGKGCVLYLYNMYSAKTKMFTVMVDILG